MLVVDFQVSVCWSLAAVEVRHPDRKTKTPSKARNGHAKNPEKKMYMWKGNLSTMDLNLGWWTTNVIKSTQPQRLFQEDYITRYLGFLENKNADGKSRNLGKKTTSLQPKGRLESFRLASACWMKAWALPSQRSWLHKESGELNLRYQSQGGWLGGDLKSWAMKCVEGGWITHSAWIMSWYSLEIWKTI